MSSVLLFRAPGHQRYRPRGNYRRRAEHYSPADHRRRAVDSGGGPSGEERARRIFRVIVLFLAAILLLEVAFHLLVAPQMVIRSIDIRARESFPMSNSEIIEAAGIQGRPYFFSVSAEEMEERLLQVPLIREAKVSKSFPDTVTIAVRSRQPIGMLMVKGERGMQQALVDSEGVVFRVGGGEVPDLPVFSGIEIPRAAAGMQLPEQIRGFLADLDRLRSEASSLYRLISEVKFVKKGESDFEVLLYPAHYRVRVRLGPTLDTHTLKYIMLVLDVISGRGMEEVTEVDFRTDDVVYRVGEE
jgi:cell division protein FtsQ